MAQTTTSPAAVSQTTTTAAPPETTTAAEPAPTFEPTLLSYRYPSDGTVEYSLAIEQNTEVTLDGGPAEEMPPGPIETATTLEGSISYHTSPGPEENTTAIRMVSDLRVIDIEMSMGGVGVPAPPGAQAPGFETPIDITVVVDHQGNVLEFAGEALDGIFGAESFLPTSPMGSQELRRPFGPAFPDHSVDVGDTWTERTEQEGPAGMGMMVTTGEHRLVGVDTEAGRTILVVESEYRTEAFEWDMSEFLQGLFAFADGFDDEDPLQTEQVPEFALLVSASPTTVIATTRFDSDAGLVVEGDYQASGEFTTDMTVPEETGDPARIITSTSYDQTVIYKLSSPAA